MFQINFTDDSYVQLFYAETPTAREIYSAENGALYIDKGGTVYSPFTTEKTDKDGNKWRVRNGVFTIKDPNNNDILNVNIQTNSTGYLVRTTGGNTYFKNTYSSQYSSLDWSSISVFIDNVNGANDDFSVSIQNHPTWLLLNADTSSAGLVLYNGTLSPYFFGAGGTNLTNYITQSEEEIPDPPEDTDPYANGGGASTTGGGGGDFDGTSTAINHPGLPTLSAVDSGFITLFNPSLTELRNLAAYMWSGLFDLNSFKKLFADPMNCILGLSIVPVNVPAGGQASVKVGNIDTGIQLTKASSQYVQLNCGSINIKEFWGSYLDYAPYTKAYIYLPYIGTHPLAMDDVMNKTLDLQYNIDILSGACTATLKCTDSIAHLDSVLYNFIGQCSCSIPITGDNFTNVINGVLNIAGAVGSMVMTDGATAPAAAGTIASAVVNNLKPEVEKSGGMAGVGGLLGIQTPYIILTRPDQAVPKSQNSFVGYPAYIRYRLGELSGYTEIEEIHLQNVNATQQEKSEIEQLLKGGVLL